MHTHTRFSLLILAAAVTAPAAAFAHAELLKSDPIENGVLAVGAKEVVFTYEEAITPASCKLTTPDGKDVASLGKPRADGMVLHIPIAKPLAGGVYKIGCRVVGPDSHPVNDAISFTVK